MIPARPGFNDRLRVKNITGRGELDRESQGRTNQKCRYDKSCNDVYIWSPTARHFPNSILLILSLFKSNTDAKDQEIRK
jgi:hypothetical protein